MHMTWLLHNALIDSHLYIVLDTKQPAAYVSLFCTKRSFIYIRIVEPVGTRSLRCCLLGQTEGEGKEELRQGRKKWKEEKKWREEEEKEERELRKKRKAGREGA